MRRCLSSWRNNGRGGFSERSGRTPESQRFLHRGRRPARPGRACLHGFTLVELLVVIAIIALLVSILAPSLDGVLAKARTSVCATNMRGLATASAAYSANNDDYLPYNRPSMSVYQSYLPRLTPYLSLAEQSWTWAVYSKLRPPYPLWCPEVTSFATGTYDYTGCTQGTSYGSNYATLNYYHENQNRPTQSAKAFPMNLNRMVLAVKHPEKTMYYMETFRDKAFPQYHFPEWWISDMPRIRYRHPQHKAMNVLYFDLHVALETYDFIYYEASQQNDDGNITWSPTHPFWYVNY